MPSRNNKLNRQPHERLESVLIQQPKPSFVKPGLTCVHAPNDPPIVAHQSIVLQNPGLGKHEITVFGGYTKLEDIAIKLAIAQVHQSGMANAKGCADTAESILAECAKRQFTQPDHEGNGELILGQK